MHARLAKIATILVTSATASGLLAGVAIAAHSPFKTGTYRGKTSQGAKFVVAAGRSGQRQLTRAPAAGRLG